MLTAIWAILIFCVLIFIHEFGHFITAKLSGMTVHEFSIGMGPKLFGFGKKSTKYSLRLLPVGGFVKLEGEDGESDDPGAFCNKSAIKRFVVLFAGAFMNILLGFLIFFIVYSSVPSVSTNEVDSVIENSPMDQIGVQSGDKIIKLKGKDYSTSVHLHDDIYLFLYVNKTNEAEITIDRDGTEFTEKITPVYNEETGGIILGFNIKQENPGFIDTISLSFWKCIYVIKSVFLSLYRLITGFIPASEVGGPVAIVSQIGTAARYGWISVMEFAGLISVNLGVMNLLPIPALDGGRILFLGIEKIRRKKMKPETEGTINFVFFALLILVMLLVTFSDVKKLL